jgi:hypothetical protein
MVYINGDNALASCAFGSAAACGARKGFPYHLFAALKAPFFHQKAQTSKIGAFGSRKFLLSWFIRAIK